LTQELIYRLTRLKGLRVIAVEADEPDARYGAGMALRGSVRRSNDTVRVTTHLVDAATGSYLWSESINVPLGDSLDAQDAIANTIIDGLQPERLQRGDIAWGQKPIENLAAHNLYLQGRYHLKQRTEEGLVTAVEFFEKAIVEDPQYAEAHSGLSDAHGLLAHYGVLGPADVWAKAASSAATAVLLDGNSAEARTSLAHVKSTQDWDWRSAEREFQRAVALDPRYATAHHWYGISCPCRWDGSTRRWSRCCWRSRSILSRRSSRATSASFTTGGTSARARTMRPHDRAQSAFCAGVYAEPRPGAAG
jgi:serine/threonine-protein kinase